MERYTSCTVELELYDTGAMDDSTFSYSNKQTFSDIESIRKENDDLTLFATLEPDFFLLDGSLNYYDTINTLKEETGYMSRYFASNIKSVFGSYHSSVGVTFHFYGSLPDEINIQFLDGESLVEEATFYPKEEDCEISKLIYNVALQTDDNVNLFTADYKTLFVNQNMIKKYAYFAEILAANYNNMIITFNNQSRFTRLDYIDYGTVLKYGDGLAKKVKSASLTEEIDILSTTLPINESSIEVIDELGLFEITNPKSYYQFLQKRQRFKIYETIDDITNLVAIHYLKEWSQTKEMLASFSLQDVIGLMSETTFYGGMYENVKASALIEEIMNDYGFDNYSIDDDLKNIELTGYLKKQTHREALQQVAFALGACVSTSRIEGINIFKPNLENNGIIDSDRKLISKAHEITQKDLVTGVSLTAHAYAVDDSKTTQALKGTFNPGTYRTTFSSPYANLSITGGTIINSNCNYADINVEEAGEVIINGYKYEDHGVIYSQKTNTYSSSTDENIVEVTDATLVDSSNVEDLLDYIYNIKQYRLKHELQIINENEQAANMYAIKCSCSYAPILITKLITDLTGGFTSQVEGIGYALKIIDYSRTGEELYAGSEGIL